MSFQLDKFRNPNELIRHGLLLFPLKFIFRLQSSNLSIEEFHHSLQDVTNFPLRPFVLPFLRTHLPLLQREVHALARANKQVCIYTIRKI